MEPTPAHIKKGLLLNMSTNIREIKIVYIGQSMRNTLKNIGKNLTTLQFRNIIKKWSQYKATQFAETCRTSYFKKNVFIMWLNKNISGSNLIYQPITYYGIYRSAFSNEEQLSYNTF